MQNIHYYMPLVTYLALYGIALGALTSIPKLKGKRWLLWFLVIHVFTIVLNYLPDSLFSDSDSPDQYRAFLFSWGYTTQFLSVVSFAMLVAFVLGLKPTSEAAMGRMLFSFRGRVKRLVFWIVNLTLLVVNSYALYLISTFSLGDNVSKSGLGKAGVAVSVTCLSLWFLASSWISLATQVKRWHDRDKSGWWVLIGLIPLIGGIWALIETGFLAGTPHSNRFDPQPSPEPFVPSSPLAVLSGPQSDAT